MTSREDETTLQQLAILMTEQAEETLNQLLLMSPLV
jgi:hypothetical protein